MSRRNDWRFADESLTNVIDQRKGGRALGQRRQPGVMNKTETLFSGHLDLRGQVKEILWWAFEGMSFRIAERCYYTPDFDVLTADYELQCIDVKGTQSKQRKNGEIYSTDYTEDDARVKLAACAHIYPISFWIAYLNEANNWILKEVHP
jgi:hypothetical protein